MNRLQMEASLTLHGWRPVTWQMAGGGEWGLTAQVLTHPEAGFVFYQPETGACRAGASSMAYIVEGLPDAPWGIFSDEAIACLYAGLITVGAI